MSPKIQHGNQAKVDPKKNTVPVFLTNNIVTKKPQHNNSIPQPLESNTIIAKKEVDENKK